MPDSFKFELVSPERLLVSQSVESVVIPGTEGEMTVMAHHAPVMTSLRAGLITVKPAEGGEERYVVFGGFADILPETVTVLAESATAHRDLDRDALQRRIEETREHIAAAESPEHRTRLEEYLHQLTMLDGVVIPG